MLFVKSTKVRRASDRYPACFDQSPAQPLVAKGQELPMPCLATAGMSGGDYSGISAQFFRAGKALDRVHFARDYCGHGRSDSWHAQQLLMHRFAPKLQPNPFFLRLHLLSNQIMQSQLLAQKGGICFGQFQPAQKAQPAHAKDVRALRQLQAALSIQQRMDAVTQHGAQPCPIESLPQKIFAHSRLAPRHMGARHQVAPQQRAQCVGIEPVRLDLRIGNQPRLVGMGQHHLLYPFELFKLIVNAAPIPARFHYRLAWPSQARKKLSETKRRVALHAGFSQLPASLIHCATHTVLLVNVYSNVIHENSSFLFFSTLRTEGLLSFYLTLFCFCSHVSGLKKDLNDFTPKLGPLADSLKLDLDNLQNAITNLDGVEKGANTLFGTA